MTIHLPPHIESSILAAVHSGRFASLDEAMTEAAFLLVRRVRQEQPQAKPPAELAPDPLLGSMADHADLIDQIIDNAGADVPR
jgi:Arc/MetJ-type ribon-helix-helix transcriptional regulator